MLAINMHILHPHSVFCDISQSLSCQTHNLSLTPLTPVEQVRSVVVVVIVIPHPFPNPPEHLRRGRIASDDSVDTLAFENRVYQTVWLMQADG